MYRHTQLNKEEKGGEGGTSILTSPFSVTKQHPWRMKYHLQRTRRGAAGAHRHRLSPTHPGSCRARRSVSALSHALPWTFWAPWILLLPQWSGGVTEKLPRKGNDAPCPKRMVGKGTEPKLPFLLSSPEQLHMLVPKAAPYPRHVRHRHVRTQLLF